jgi:predicted dehydrogenase
LGQGYVRAYSSRPDTEVVAIAEYNDDRRTAVGERFGVNALYKDVTELLKDDVPDIAAVVTPTKFMKEAVIACAEAGVKGVSTDKPLAARLSDADEMVETCRARGVVYSGGNLQRAMPEVQDAASRIRSGEFGSIVGAAVHGWGGTISGGGCQHIAVVTLLADARVEEVIAWGSPQEALEKEDDEGLFIHGRFRLANGLECQVFGQPTPCRGASVWSEDSLIEWDWAPPAIYKGFDANGRRIKIDPNYGYEDYETRGDKYLGNSIRAFLAAVESGSELAISGDDLRHALEVAVAVKQSALMGNRPVKLPLADRSLSLLPVPYRWLGGDASGSPQSVEEAAGRASRT